MAANPQTENGYTKIANEIMDALAKMRIPGEARQVLDVIIRKTYGWGKKKDAIATSQFMALTGLKKGMVHRARKRLLYANLITVYKNDDSQVLSYSFQKDYTKWDKLYAKKTILKKVTDCMQKSAQTVPIIVGDNINKETIQKKGKPLQAQLPDDEFIKKLKESPAYKGIDINRELAKMDTWLFLPANRNRKKTMRFIVNWLNKCDPAVNTKSKDDYESYIVRK